MSIRRQFTVNQSRLPTEAGGWGGQTVDLNGDNLAFNWTHSFSPTLHNEARFGFTHFPTRFDTLIQEPLNARLGIKNAPGDSFGDGFDQGFSHFNLGFPYDNLGTPCCWPNINNMDNIQIVDNLMWQRGSHNIKIGFDYRRLNVFREAMRFRRGEFRFTKVFTAEQPNNAVSRNRTGNQLAEMMLGWVGRTRVGNSDGENAIVPYWGIYLQDDWKVTPKLTLTLGLRWELFHRGYFPKGHIPGRTGVSNYITAVNGLPPGQEEFLDRPTDGSDCGCEHDLNNFAPRLGIAYRLNDKTVVRASGGVFYGEADFVTVGTGWARQAPDFTEVIIPTLDRITPVTLVKDGFLPVKLPADEPLPFTQARVAYRKLPTQYVAQWFVDIQRELPQDMVWIVGYQGSSSSHLTYIRDLNFAGPHPTIPAVFRRLRPERSSVVLFEPGANASYNALVTRLEKRFTRGLTFLTSYTWAHNIDNSTQFTDFLFFLVANPNDRRAERSSADIDRKHSFTTSFTWELPFGKGRAFGSKWGGALDAIAGGWQVGGILSLRSGFPYPIIFLEDPQNTGTSSRGNRIADGRLSNPTIDNWFDQSAFVISDPGVYGNSGRNVLRGPGARNFDFMLSKRFRMPWEGHALQFRFEAFNLTNTPRFGQPFSVLGVPRTGTIRDAEEPRRIQFGLKYLF